MNKLLAVLLSLALVANSLADSLEDLGHLDTALSGKLTEFTAAKQNLESDIENQRIVVKDKQDIHDEAQELYLQKQKAYWAAYDTWQKSVENATEKANVLASKEQALQDAIEQKTGCSVAMVDGTCTTCLQTDYSCSGVVASVPHTLRCDCDGYRTLLRHQYNEELQRIDTVLGGLVEGDGNPINEYQQRSDAQAEMIELQTSLNQKLIDIQLQEDVHNAFIAELQRLRDIAAVEWSQAVTHRDALDIVQQNANDELSSAESALAPAGNALNAAMQTLKSLQRDYKDKQTEYFDALNNYRDELKSLTSILDTHQVSAKTALYFDKCGYAQFPTVNLRKSFTIEFWAYFDVNMHNREMLPSITQARIPGQDDTKFVFQIKLRGGPREKEVSGSIDYDYYFWDARMGSPDSPGYAVRMWGHQYIPHGWTHVAFVVDSTEDPSTTKGTLYVNGEEEYVKYFFGTRWSSMEPIQLMKYEDDKGKHCSHGMIDELRIWSVARTKAEIVAKMHAVVDGRTEPLRSYYRFDERKDQPDYRENVINDYTPNRLDGKILYPSSLPESPVKYTESTAFEPPYSTFKTAEFSLYLDSTPDHPNYLALPSQDFRGSFTIETWVNVRTTKDDPKRLPKIALPVHDGTRREEFVFVLELIQEGTNDYHFMFTMGGCRSSTEEDCAFALELKSDQMNSLGWRHVAVTMSRNNVATILIDGACVDTANCRKEMSDAESSARLTSSHTIDVGRIVDDSGFHGSQCVIDELRFWNNARTVDQINAFKSRRIPQATLEKPRSNRDIAAYYRLDEAAGVQKVYDSVVRDPSDPTDKEQLGSLVGPRVRLVDIPFTS